MLANLMANQAGLPPLDFGPIDQTINLEGYERYIRAIHQGVGRDNSCMEEIFEEIIEFSEKSV